MNTWRMFVILILLSLSLAINCYEKDANLLKENNFSDQTNEAQFLKMFSKVLFIILVIILYE